MINLNYSNTEGKTHKEVKRLIVKRFEKSEKFKEIETEKRIYVKPKYPRRVDVYALTNKDKEVFIEIKSDANIANALLQLLFIRRVKGKDCIYICVTKEFTPIYFKRLRWARNPIFKENVNGTMFFIYDDNFKLKRVKVKIDKDGHVIFNGENVSKRLHTKCTN